MGRRRSHQGGKWQGGVPAGSAPSMKLGTHTGNRPYPVPTPDGAWAPAGTKCRAGVAALPILLLDLDSLQLSAEALWSGITRQHFNPLGEYVNAQNLHKKYTGRERPSPQQVQCT